MDLVGAALSVLIGPILYGLYLLGQRLRRLR